MFKTILAKITGRKAEKVDTSSKFSKFFRNASSAEKKKVFLEVAREAAEEQREFIRSVEKELKVMNDLKSKAQMENFIEDVEMSQDTSLKIAAKKAQKDIKHGRTSSLGNFLRKREEARLLRLRAKLPFNQEF